MSGMKRAFFHTVHAFANPVNGAYHKLFAHMAQIRFCWLAHAVVIFQTDQGQFPFRTEIHGEGVINARGMHSNLSWTLYERDIMSPSREGNVNIYHLSDAISERASAIDEGRGVKGSAARVHALDLS